MKRIILCLIIFCLFLYACSSEKANEQKIDYSTLPVLKVNQVLEIGESEDFIPGRLRDLVVASDGSILVSDWGSTTIEQFSPDGSHIKTVAAEGGGPGELTRYFDLVDISYDSVLVRHQGRRNDFFGQNKQGQFTFGRSVVHDSPSARYSNIIVHRSNNDYYAMSYTISDDIQKALTNQDDYGNRVLVITDMNENILADSLYLLKSPSPYIKGSLDSGISVYTIPYRYQDRFVVMNNGNYLLARPDSSSIFMYDEEHNLKKRIPLDVVKRPITSEDINYELGDIEIDVRRELEDRLPEYKPPYLDVWVTDEYIWLHTDTGLEGKEIVVLDFEGVPAGKFLIPDVDEIEHIEDTKIYTIHKDPDVGDSIRIYEAEV